MIDIRGHFSQELTDTKKIPSQALHNAKRNFDLCETRCRGHQCQAGARGDEERGGERRGTGRGETRSGDGEVLVAI